MSRIDFKCGCSFPLDENNRVIFDPRIDHLRLDCPATYDLICSGDTLGVFQLESNLGKSLSKRVAPKNIEELSDLVSIMRPGSMEAYIGDKTATNRYIDRKSGKEQIEYLHPALEPILKNTQGILCIHEDTYISLKDGTEKQIKNVNSGDEIISINTRSSLTEFDLCTGCKPSPKTQGYELILENGYRLILTNDHPVLTQRGWVEIQNLDITKDVVQTIINQIKSNNNNYIESKHTDFISNDKNIVAYLYGQLLGDGCAGEAIASGTKINHDKLYNWLSNNIPTLLYRPYFNVRSYYIGIHSEKIGKKTTYRQFIEHLGLNKTKKDKIIHDDIFKLNDEPRRAFVAGLFDSDGHFSFKSNNSSICHIASSTPQIINGIRKLLSIDGIETYIDNEYKHIYILNIEKFKLLYNKYIVIKKIESDNLTSASHYGSFPKNIIREQIYNLGYTNLKKFCKNNNIGESVLVTKLDKFCNIQTAKKCGFNFGDTTFMQIKSITKIYNQLKFYSISVSNNHNLIGNGIVIKNCYQEQAMTIAKELAGFNLSEADSLRKSIGKKLADEMAKVKVLFITKAKEKGILSDSEAETIFSWIEASQRYSFNKSHGISYALDAYISAYCKAHFSKEFFCSYLANSRTDANFTDVVRALVDNARQHNIQVYPPDIRKRNLNFKLYEDGIYCGISNVKKVGATILNSINDLIKQKEESLNKKIGDLSWTEFLLNISPFIKKDALQSLILSGALSFTKVPRKRMLYEFEKFLDLTDRDISFLLNISGESILERLIVLRDSEIGRGKPLSSKRRKEAISDIIKQLEQPPYPLVDSALWVSETEQQLIGVSLTCSKVDDCDQSAANSTCKDFIDTYRDYYMIAAQINEVKEHAIRNGKKKGEKMAFIKISDSSCALDNVICFPEAWVTVQDLFIPGNTVMVGGTRDKKNQNTLVVGKAWQI